MTPDDVAAWWDGSRPGEPRATWVESFVSAGCASSEELGTLDYRIRLAPPIGEPPPVPPLDPESLWCGVFEMRRPEACPRGIAKSSVG